MFRILGDVSGVLQIQLQQSSSYQYNVTGSYGEMLYCVAVFLPAVLCAAVSVSKLLPVPENAAPVDASTKIQLQRGACLITFAVAALQPGLLLIDHGHFQYNGIGLGLSVCLSIASPQYCTARYPQTEQVHNFWAYILASVPDIPARM